MNKKIIGDCIVEMGKMNEGSVDMILTDPPYLINFRSNHRKVKFDNIKGDDDPKLIKDFVKESFRVLKDNSAFYCFCSWHNVGYFKDCIEDAGFKIKNVIIWVKNNTGMGDLKGSYAPKYEMIIFAVKGKRNLNGYRHPDVLHFKRVPPKLHPTEKPVDLLELLLSTSSNEGDTVLDPFAGSGSTGKACENLGRNCILIEKDENYLI